MDESISLEQILDFAVKRAATSVEFYSRSAEHVEDDRLVLLLEELASDESTDHEMLTRSMLKAKTDNGAITIPRSRVGAYLVDMKPTCHAHDLRPLVWAMVRAETSARLYTRVAEYLDDRAWKRLFERLAEDQDERKKRLEREYDRVAMGRLRENATV